MHTYTINTYIHCILCTYVHCTSIYIHRFIDYITLKNKNIIKEIYILYLEKKIFFSNSFLLYVLTFNVQSLCMYVCELRKRNPLLIICTYITGNTNVRYRFAPVCCVCLYVNIYVTCCISVRYGSVSVPTCFYYINIYPAYIVLTAHCCIFSI